MASYRNVKKTVSSILDFTELYIINKAVAYRYKLEVKKKIRNIKGIDDDYKKECMQYWTKYTDKFKYYWHQYYTYITGVNDVRYIPDDLYFTYIDQYYNNRKLGWGVNDKNYYNIWFPNIKQPNTIIRKVNNIFYDENYHIITLDKALDKCNKHNEFIIKPAIDNGAGQGIIFFRKEKDQDSLENLLNGNKLGRNFIVQEIVEQHECLSSIHKHSLNTLRIISLIINGEVKILSSILRMGVNNNRVDNGNMGGIACGILDNGQLKGVAFDLKGNKYTQHPQGFLFRDCIVPSYDKATSIVKQQHEKLAHFRLVSWDIAIDSNGIAVLIEANMRNGGIKYHQYCNGPLFGEYTEEVLKEVFINED